MALIGTPVYFDYNQYLPKETQIDVTYDDMDLIDQMLEENPEEPFQLQPQPQPQALELSDAHSCALIPDYRHILVVGVPKTGKTTFVRYAVYENRKKFHKFKVICPTNDYHKLYDFLPQEDIYTDPDMDTIRNILEEQKALGGRSKLLLILDDIVGVLNMKDKVFDLLCTQGRHAGISMWVVTQHLNNVLRPMFRECCGTIYVTKVRDSAIKTLKNLVSGFTGEKDLISFLEMVCRNYNIVKFDMNAGYDDPYKIFNIPPTMKRYYIDNKLAKKKKENIKK